MQNCIEKMFQPKFYDIANSIVHRTEYKLRNQLVNAGWLGCSSRFVFKFTQAKSFALQLREILERRIDYSKYMYSSKQNQENIQQTISNTIVNLIDPFNNDLKYDDKDESDTMKNGMVFSFVLPDKLCSKDQLENLLAPTLKKCADSLAQINVKTHCFGLFDCNTNKRNQSELTEPLAAVTIAPKPKIIYSSFL